MAEYKCPKCGKIYKRKGKYFNQHVEKCMGEKSSVSISSKRKPPLQSNDIAFILKKIENIEFRLEKLESQFKLTNKNHLFNSKIGNENIFFDIIREKVNFLSKKMLGIPKVRLKDLFEEIKKEYHISKEEFSDYLIKLNSLNKIQLEPGMDSNGFSIIGL
ncbi:MAG: hypothetical protein ACTSQP_24025 [Promethearchaeota archaeon]